jgi:hypothetical protein
LGYNLGFLPLELTVMYSPEIGKVYSHVKLGSCFKKITFGIYLNYFSEFSFLHTFVATGKTNPSDSEIPMQ